MTISYQHDVNNGFNGFTKLLVKWKGSVYNMVYKELIVYLLLYFAVRAVYKTLLDKDQQTVFEMVSIYCARYIDLIPLVFVLGFYVTFVAQRWWTQFTTIPFPDGMMNAVNMYIDGCDERGRTIRRTLMRYWNSSFVMMMITISTAVQKRFPTLDSLVKAGYMTEDELSIFTSFQINANKFWIPMNWFIQLLNQVRVEGRIRDEIALRHIIEELNDFRSKLRLLWCHDWVTLPLVYTQVVTLATHCFFLISIISRQYLNPEKKYPGHEIDFYVPIFAILQFLFYMGWLKVAEQLINPFGEDEDDIECNWLIDRHLQVSYLGVDDLSFPDKMPNSCKDPRELRPTVNLSQNVVPPENRDGGDSQMYARRKSIQQKEKRSARWKKIFSCCRKVTDSSGKNLFTQRPKMLGKKDLLLSIECIAKINTGRWKFEVDSAKEQDLARAMDCIFQMEPNNVDSSEAQWRREQMTNQGGSLPATNRSFRPNSTLLYRLSLPPYQRHRETPPHISKINHKNLVSTKGVNNKSDRINQVGLPGESFSNVNNFLKYPSNLRTPVTASETPSDTGSQNCGLRNISARACE